MLKNSCFTNAFWDNFCQYFQHGSVLRITMWVGEFVIVDILIWATIKVEKISIWVRVQESGWFNFHRKFFPELFWEQECCLLCDDELISIAIMYWVLSTCFQCFVLIYTHSVGLFKQLDGADFFCGFPIILWSIAVEL